MDSLLLSVYFFSPHPVKKGTHASKRDSRDTPDTNGDAKANNNIRALVLLEKKMRRREMLFKENFLPLLFPSVLIWICDSKG